MLSSWYCRESPDEGVILAKDFLAALDAIGCEKCDSWRPRWIPGGCMGPVKEEEA